MWVYQSWRLVTMATFLLEHSTKMLLQQQISRVAPRHSTGLQVFSDCVPCLLRRVQVFSLIYCFCTIVHLQSNINCHALVIHVCGLRSPLSAMHLCVCECISRCFGNHLECDKCYTSHLNRDLYIFYTTLKCNALGNARYHLCITRTLEV